MQAQVNTFNKVITHGDLNPSNIDKAGYVIDWDCFGLYPIGYDIALCLSKFDNLESLNLELFLKKHFMPRFKHSLEWQQFLFSVSFFLFILASRRVSRRLRKDPNNLLLKLYSNLLSNKSNKNEGSILVPLKKSTLPSKLQDMTNNKTIKQYNLNRVKALLDYCKTTDKPYNGRTCTAGYHTLNILGYELKGQRDPKHRFELIPIDFHKKSVLDIGSNSGGMLLHIANQLRWGVGIDFEPKLVNISNILAKLDSASNLDFYAFDVDAEFLDLIPNFFPEPSPPDIVLLLAVTAWIKNWAGLLDWVADLGSVLVCETTGSIEIMQRDLSYLKKKFKIVQEVSSQSLDCSRRKNRKMYVCSHHSELLDPLETSSNGLIYF